MWEDGIPGNVTSFLPQTSFWPEEGNDDSLQVMMMMYRKLQWQQFQVIDCYAKPVEPESCEALDTLDYSDKNAGEVDFLPNYLSG